MGYAEFLKTHKVMLAPMAGVSDPAFRQLCAEQGASLAFTEMVSVKGLSYANERTAHLVDLYDGEALAGVQIFGHEPETMAEQAQWIEDVLGDRLAVIDINMGCPVKKIAGKGDGAALIKDPVLAGQIISAVAHAVRVPVTVKTRRGYYEGSETCIDFARMAESSGAAAIAVHGRFATQMYRGKADWDCITRTKAAVDIPVIGNGDVFSAEDALALFDKTGCDAILVARGAEGNPWIFAQINAALGAAQGESPTPLASATTLEPGGAAASYPTPVERIEMARKHAHLLHEREPRSVVRMRKHACWYVKGIPGASAARATFNSCTTVEDFDQAFDGLLLHLSQAEASHVGVD